MCGICGQIALRTIDEGLLRRMTRALAHRGPDDEGIVVRGGAGLGHRRLSIIDLDAGRQPLTNADGTLWIVFNGEIYNFQQLRSDLIRRGHRLVTRSDTETILHLYEEYGTDCLRCLRGMFAFAIWDAPRQRLFAARDHLGQKPFYYAERNDGLLFASEIKGLTAADPGLRRLDPSALDEYLTLRIIPPPRSMFRDIRKLPPGHYLTFGPREGLHIQRYWRPSYVPKLTGSDDELVDELECRLIDSIRHHLVSDVPVGAFLSGGLDSTLIVALLMRHGLSDEFQTFSVGLPYGRFDEAPAARLVAERYGTRHREREIRPSLLAALPQLVHQLDEPSDPLSVCMFMIAGMAREHVKVVLGGDGGDELFGGYDRYYGNLYSGYYALIPAGPRRHVIGYGLGLLTDGRWYKSTAHQLKWLHHLSFYQGGERYRQSLSYFYFQDAFKDALYGSEMQRLRSGLDSGAAIRDAYDDADADHPIDRMLYADSQVRLPDHPVMIQDRMTMAHGLEARSPFMDHELAEFAARLPIRLKVRGRRLRYIQTRLAGRHLPEAVMRRKKQGFSSALTYMLREELDALYRVFLHDTHLARDGLLRQGAIDGLLRNHQAGRADHGNRLWLLVNSEVWYRMNIIGQPVDDIAADIEGHAAAATTAA